MITTAAILAGGQSRRMGADKALLALAGVTLLERVARTAGQVCAKVLIVGRPTPPPEWPGDLPAEFLPDGPHSAATPGGPLVGLLTALEHTGGPVLLLACDTPLLTPGTLRELLAAHDLAAAATIATMATTCDAAGQVQAEPTLAVYTPALVPVLQSMLAENRRSLQPLLGRASVNAWRVPAEHVPEMLNVNDPETLRIAEELVRR